MTTNDEIDMAVVVLGDLLKVGATFYPPLAIAVPVISMFIKCEAKKLKDGIADGTIVADGQGGWVPASNSRFDPKTGEFL